MPKKGSGIIDNLQDLAGLPIVKREPPNALTVKLACGHRKRFIVGTVRVVLRDGFSEEHARCLQCSPKARKPTPYRERYNRMVVGGRNG